MQDWIEIWYSFVAIWTDLLDCSSRVSKGNIKFNLKDLFEKKKLFDLFFVEEFCKKAFPNKMPKQESLQALTPILAKIHKNYKKFNFNACFAKYCPLPEDYLELKDRKSVV